MHVAQMHRRELGLVLRWQGDHGTPFVGGGYERGTDFLAAIAKEALTPENEFPEIVLMTMRCVECGVGDKCRDRLLVCAEQEMLFGHGTSVSSVTRGARETGYLDLVASRKFRQTRHTDGKTTVALAAPRSTKYS